MALTAYHAAMQPCNEYKYHRQLRVLQNATEGPSFQHTVEGDQPSALSHRQDSKARPAEHAGRRHMQISSPAGRRSRAAAVRRRCAGGRRRGLGGIGRMQPRRRRERDVEIEMRTPSALEKHADFPRLEFRTPNEIGPLLVVCWSCIDRLRRGHCPAPLASRRQDWSRTG